mmetsp:Transcript_32571/g.95333  ORF Transcript_32571/g.95333 Transcript_32571/m.95333 type:complete len:188 (-) Transcript_32571:258-821(-)
MAVRDNDLAELYGGAMTCELPRSFVDASQMREVPDHQEVWVDTATDRSFIVEVLDRKTEVPDDQAITFFLEDLASFNDAKEAAVLISRRAADEETPGLPPDTVCLVGAGEQLVAKFAEASANRVKVHICAVRLVEQETDLLITLNDPVAIDPQSSSAVAPVAQAGEELFAQVLRSFRIVDWTLFTPS